MDTCAFFQFIKNQNCGYSEKVFIYILALTSLTNRVKGIYFESIDLETSIWPGFKRKKGNSHSRIKIL